MADVVEIWADTGEVVERDFTTEEAAQRAADLAATEAAAVEASAMAQAKEAARMAAIEHARSLGFTDEMVAAMGLAVSPPSEA